MIAIYRNRPGGGGQQRTARSRRKALVTRLLAGSAIASVALSVILASPATVLAADVPLVVTFRTPPEATIGAEVIVTATIRRGDRLAPTDLRVGLYINGTFQSSARADSSGNLSFRVSGLETAVAGTFNLEARFAGARGLAPARATARLKLRPAAVKVATVPPVAGVPISIGDQTATTGADGTAAFVVDKVGPVPLEAKLDSVADDAVRVSFIRWGDQVYDAKRSINVRGDVTFVLGLRTAVRAGVKFVDQDGAVVDSANITRVRFTSSTGGELVLTSFDSTWWESGTAVSRTGGLQPASTLWRLNEVEMAGTNVVHQGQQAFSPTANGTWAVTLLLFDLVVQTNDALTGSALSGTAVLEFPDSRKRTSPLDGNGSARFEDLPRGSYVVTIKTDGIAPVTPIALSRSQDARIRVITYVDLALVGSVLLAGLVILIWIGRRRELPWLARTSAASSVVARRLSLDGAPAAARRRLPAATSALASVPADIRNVSQGRGAAALSFGVLLVRHLARMVITVAALGARVTVAAVRSVIAAITDRRVSATRAVPGQTTQQRPGAGTLPSPAPAEAAVSWPAPTSLDSRPVIQPVITIRTSGTSQPVRQAPRPTGGWFDPDPEEDGPWHECKTCHRQVLDSARFCRSCGHRQD